jgi:hypothetical protein
MKEDNELRKTIYIPIVLVGILILASMVLVYQAWDAFANNNCAGLGGNFRGFDFLHRNNPDLTHMCTDETDRYMHIFFFLSPSIFLIYLLCWYCFQIRKIER